MARRNTRLFLMLLIGISITSAGRSQSRYQLRQWASHLSWTKSLSDTALQELVKNPYSCYVVPHTHWDKEWAFSFEQHHLALVKLVDNVITILEKDPDFKYFILDGQASLIVDYLSTRPEMRERVKSLVQAGRFLIGPWYTQTDMLVASGEELVRNLKWGIQICRSLGGEMAFGYTADNFGFCAQLPQIYRGFGIQRAALYRGPAEDSEIYKAVFEWCALDGSSVMVANMLGPAGYLLFTWPYDVPDMPEAYLLKSLHFLTPAALTNDILLPAGSDAEEADRDLPKILQQLDREFPHLDFKIATFDQYLDAVLAKHPKVPKFRGLMRSISHSCPGAISSRMNIKQANAAAYTTLENFAEPFSALAWLISGRRYPTTSLERAWKYLFENLSHDDMGGACFDKVYTANAARYFEAERLAETLAIRGMKTLVESIETPNKSDFLRKPVVVFNPLPWKRTDVVEMWVPMKMYSGHLRQPFYDGEFSSFQVRDLDGNLLPSCVSSETRPEDGGDYLRVQFIIHGVPSCGYKTVQLVATNEPTTSQLSSTGVTDIENHHFRLSFHPDGRFDLYDKKTATLYPNLHHFEDQYAPGSPWNFTPKGKTYSTIDRPATLTLVEDGSVAKTMKVEWKDWQVLSHRENESMVNMPITSFVTIYSDVGRVDVYTEVENNAFNHRLRVAFPVTVNADSFAAGVQFGVQHIPVYDPYKPASSPWDLEYHPHLDWLDVSDEHHGFAVFDRGTPSASVHRTASGTKILLTLLRATGSHFADARPSLPHARFSSVQLRIGAQMLGTHSFEYSIFPHQGDWQQAGVVQHAENTHVRLWPETLWRQDMPKWQVGPYGFEEKYRFPRGSMSTEQRFLEIKPEGIIMSALKKAEKDDALVLRFYNSLPKPQTYQIDFFRAVDDVQLVNMIEEKLADQSGLSWQVTQKDRTQVTFRLKQYEIITIKLFLKAPVERSWFHTKY